MLEPKLLKKLHNNNNQKKPVRLDLSLSTGLGWATNLHWQSDPKILMLTWDFTKEKAFRFLRICYDTPTLFVQFFIGT